MEILIVIAILIISISAVKKFKSSGNLLKKPQSYEEMRETISITLSPEQQKRENQKYSEITELTILDMESSGYFKPDCIPDIAKKIREKTDIGYRYYNPFNEKDCLTLKEKKELGLNTRGRYSRELVSALTEKGISSEDQNELLKNIWQADQMN